MKKRYIPPDCEITVFQIRNAVMLTGSVENGGVVIATENDDIPTVEEDLFFFT